MTGRERETMKVILLVPNLVTVVGLCAGLTSIRFVFAGNHTLAAGLIVLAALLDGLDGLIARRLGAASAFGAELDSLSDFLCFGVAPGLLVFQFALGDAGGVGWICVLVYIIGCCLRLARFNVGRAEPGTGERPHFVGVPAPAGALLALLPVFLALDLGFRAADFPLVVAAHLALVGGLMVSRLPTVSPKAIRVRRDRASWLMVGAAGAVGVALARPWLLMALADLFYAAALLPALLARGREKAWIRRR